jgi:hypothetical protein
VDKNKLVIHPQNKKKNKKQKKKKKITT